MRCSLVTALFLRQLERLFSERDSWQRKNVGNRTAENQKPGPPGGLFRRPALLHEVLCRSSSSSGFRPPGKPCARFVSGSRNVAPVFCWKVQVVDGIVRGEIRGRQIVIAFHHQHFQIRILHNRLPQRRSGIGKSLNGRSPIPRPKNSTPEPIRCTAYRFYSPARCARNC